MRLPIIVSAKRDHQIRRTSYLEAVKERTRYDALSCVGIDEDELYDLWEESDSEDDEEDEDIEDEEDDEDEVIDQEGSSSSSSSK